MKKNFSLLKILLFLVITLISSSLSIKQHLQFQEPQVSQHSGKKSVDKIQNRVLQMAGPPADAVLAQANSLLVSINSVRIKARLPRLQISSRLSSYIEGWSRTMRLYLSLTTYFQIYGIQSPQIYSFSQLAPAQIATVVPHFCSTCATGTAASMGIFYRNLTESKIELIIVLDGKSVSVFSNISSDQISKFNAKAPSNTIKNNESYPNATDGSTIRQIKNISRSPMPYPSLLQTGVTSSGNNQNSKENSAVISNQTTINNSSPTIKYNSAYQLLPSAQTYGGSQVQNTSSKNNSPFINKVGSSTQPNPSIQLTSFQSSSPQKNGDSSILVDNSQPVTSPQQVSHLIPSNQFQSSGISPSQANNSAPISSPPQTNSLQQTNKASNSTSNSNTLPPPSSDNNSTETSSNPSPIQNPYQTNKLPLSVTPQAKNYQKSQIQSPSSFNAPKNQTQPIISNANASSKQTPTSILVPTPSSTQFPQENSVSWKFPIFTATQIPFFNNLIPDYVSAGIANNSSSIKPSPLLDSTLSASMLKVAYSNSPPRTLLQNSSFMQSNITNKEFSPIILSHSLPSTFVRGETFMFRGYVAQAQGDQTVKIIFTNINSKMQKMTFSVSIAPGKSEFELPALIATTGSYYISIFVGSSGSSSKEIYKVASVPYTILKTGAPSSVSDIQLAQTKNNVDLKWNSSTPLPAITKVVFSQQSGATIVYTLSNFQVKLSINFPDFVSFKEGQTTVEICQAYSSNGSAYSRVSNFSSPTIFIFNATTHNFDLTSPEKASFEINSYRVQENSTFYLVGKASVPVLNQVVLQTPFMDFKSIPMINAGKYKSTAVAPDTPIGIAVAVQAAGVYIVELSDATGQPLINIPLYVGDIYPLLPDFKDLLPKEKDQSLLNLPQSLPARQNKVLLMLNQIRGKANVPLLYVDNSLNNASQSFAVEMTTTNSLSHVDLLGRGPQERSRIAGVVGVVGQSIGASYNLTLAVQLLLRSPIDLRNIINPMWTRVGLGIAQNINQTYYLDLLFASRDLKIYPLTPSQYLTIQKQIFSSIKTSYPQIQSLNSTLSSKLSNLFVLSTTPSPAQYLNSQGITKYSLNLSKVDYKAGDFLPSLQKQISLNPPSLSYKEIGISCRIMDGLLQCYIVYH